MVEDSPEYQRCRFCSSTFSDDIIKKIEAEKDDVYCEICGDIIIRVQNKYRFRPPDITEDEPKTNIDITPVTPQKELKPNPDAFHFPIGRIFYDEDFPLTFKTNFVFVFSRLVCFAVMRLDQEGEIKIGESEIPENALNDLYMATRKIQVPDKQIKPEFLKNLQKISKNEFESNLKKLQTKIQTNRQYLEDFHVYTRWLIRKVYLIISHGLNKDELSKLDMNLYNDLENQILYINKSSEFVKIREYIRNLDWDWDKNAPEWIVSDQKTKNPIQLDPTKDCSIQNPLYKSEIWLNRIYNDEKFNLSDRKIGELYNLGHKTIGNWRKKLNIPTKADKGRYISANGYVLILMPENYHHPELTQSPKGRIRRKEHLVVMENYLKEHPESEVSKRNLIDGKYLKIEYEVHHINHVRNDNRLENLWLFETKSEHSRAQRSLNDCFSSLYKLGQIQFKKGKYYVNYTFDYKTLDPSEVKRIIKPNEFKGDMSIEEIKREIKTLDWDKISNNWTVWKNSNQFGEVRTTVNPYKDCSKENPLYRHKLWLETIVKEKQYNLTDPRLAEVCGISESTTYKWRWNHHKIPTYYERWGNIRTINRSKSAGNRIWIKIPNDYKNPFARKLSRQNTMIEHRYVMEKYLAKHLELEISQKSLIDGKFLKPEYIVHHINLDTLDNRLENLWVCEEHTEHHAVHTSLLDTVSSLIQTGLLSFKKGKYILNCEE